MRTAKIGNLTVDLDRLTAELAHTSALAAAARLAREDTYIGGATVGWRYTPEEVARGCAGNLAQVLPGLIERCVVPEEPPVSPCLPFGVSP